MLTKNTLESKQETAGAILAEQWRCQTVILSRCQKPQYGHWNCTAWTICFSVQEKKAVEHKKSSFHGIVSVSLPQLKIMRLTETINNIEEKITHNSLKRFCEYFFFLKKCLRSDFNITLKMKLLFKRHWTQLKSILNIITTSLLFFAWGARIRTTAISKFLALCGARTTKTENYKSR